MFGTEGTSEHRAALAVKNAFERLWPGISNSPADADLVRIASGTKISGYRVSDIDLVVAASFNTERFIVPKVAFNDKEGTRVSGARVRIKSFVAAVEVKDHDANNLDISAGGISVRYKEGWKSATEQNDQQRYALLEYLKDHTRRSPWVYRCLLLQGIAELPKDRGRAVPESGAIAASFDGTSLLMAMAGVNGLSKHGRDYTISSSDPETMQAVLASSLFHSVTPSNLDRRRMDRIAARPQEAREFAKLLGEERVHFRGEGGTGKTVLLAQSAHEAFREHGKRSLFLTYNHALASDIQRLLALMAIPASGDSGGVDVRTVMSFTYSWLARLGIVQAGQLLEFKDYERLCLEATDYFDKGVLGEADLSKAKREDPDQFDYDAILVDEAQDWPQAEADLLARLYGGQSIALADGISQLVRGSATNWKASILGKSKGGHRHLAECLRMKANLGVFANAVAVRAGLNWEITPNTQAAGGRVILCRAPFAEMKGLHNRLLLSAAKHGNDPIDLLYCVPPSDVVTDANGRSSKLGHVFRSAGLKVWDGVDPGTRKDFPRTTEDHRIVQYHSCRGLEGWTAVLDGFDEFWSDRYTDAVNPTPSDLGESGVLRARAAAWQWGMIALTRPIDTLVVTLKDSSSETAKTLLAIADTLPDIVEVL